MKDSIGGKTLAKLGEFARPLAEICSRSPAVPGAELRWTIIANPKAGGFTINSRWKKHLSALCEARGKAEKNPPREKAGPSETSQREGKMFGAYGLIPTGERGHAVRLTEALLEEAESLLGDKAGRAPKPFFLIITAGGDGTSLEVLQTLYQGKPAVRSLFAVLRLPLGTGNDGADAFELTGALELLLRPVTVELSRGLKLSTVTGKTWPGEKPFLAFNILSLGLDAFVTRMTNRMKGNLPGDSYKLWVDVASLLYDKLYKVGPMEIRGFDDKGKELISINKEVLLCAMGVSGHRSYGSHKMILPDDRNVCAVKQMPLFRKLALKGLFTTGGHIDKPESILWNANRIVISAEYPILAQMDGETTLLMPEDFPAAIELTGPVIPVLRRA